MHRDYIKFDFFDADLINIQSQGHISTFGNHSVLRISMFSVAGSDLLDHRVTSISTGFTLSVVTVEYIGSYAFRTIC